MSNVLTESMERGVSEEITWKRLRIGLYEGHRGGECVIRIERTKDTGEPIWEAFTLDGTALFRDRTWHDYVTLEDAKKRYAYARKRAIGNA